MRFTTLKAKHPDILITILERVAHRIVLSLSYPIHGGISGKVMKRNSFFCSYHATFLSLKAVMRKIASPPLVHIMFSVRAHSLATEKVFIYMNILKSPKDTKTTTFSQEINNFSKTEL